MSALDIFRYEGTDVRVVLDEAGEPWFVAADVCRVLDHSNPTMAVAGLDDDEKGLRNVETLGGTQSLAVVTEPGLYALIIRSRKPEAKQFKRWLTHDVLPAIRKTGTYVAPASELDQIKALHAAVGTLLAQNAVDAPKAAAWDELAAADGDYEVADAAKILARAGIDTGRQRLFSQLADLGWIFRGSSGKWKARQSAVDSGYLTEKPMSHHHPRTGEVVLDPPQVRVTVRGLERLRVRLGVLELTP